MSSTLITVSKERALKIYNDLLAGSDPRPSFFLLVGVSTLIAAFGLVMDNTAVVIGAMLVAPLMTPILGLALALVRSDTHLSGIALRSEFIGVIISILAGVLIGLTLPEYFEPTEEMLGRTQPSLFDLLVAVLAGLAGAYALVDEKLSPVLPGVAISTAIVPPLANCGMCIALGAYSGAAGSFLLFFTNFLSILLVSAAVFIVAGMNRDLRALSGIVLARRFGFALASMALITAGLAVELGNIVKDMRVEKKITEILKAEFQGRQSHHLEQLVIDRGRDELLVRADVEAPDIVGPTTVSAIEGQLNQLTGQPTTLHVRTTITHEVSATGSINKALQKSLNGFQQAPSEDAESTRLMKAEQLIREYLENEFQLRLEHLRLIAYEKADLLLAEMSGSRPLSRLEIEELEAILKNQLPQEKPLNLSIQHTRSEIRDKQGRVRPAFNIPRFETAGEQAHIKTINEFIRQWLNERGFWIHSQSYTLLEEHHYFLLEVYGGRLFGTEDWAAFNEALKRNFDAPIDTYVRSQLETVVGPEGEGQLDELLEDFRLRNERTYKEEMDRLINQGR
ncbi:MAG: DUF389 domain-containing protein [Halioglobus sp.]